MQDLRFGGREVCNFYQVEKSSRFKISDTTQLKPIFFLPYPYLQYCNTNRYRNR